MRESTYSMSLSQAADAIGRGELTARALAEAELARVEATDASIEAWAHLDPRRIAPGDYESALATRAAAIAFFTDWLGGFDAILTPSAPGPAPAGLESTGDPSCCTLWSLTGFPVLTIPIALAANGLPLGLQLAAPAGEDDRVLAVAAWCESCFAFRESSDPRRIA